ncbi:MAG: hypothetical protein VKQ33_08625 [Candidatus Sericytochromatia bacterium]|nr:hypothetical protein [Candidatus Sericytochromatia bacterium]
MALSLGAPIRRPSRHDPVHDDVQERLTVGDFSYQADFNAGYGIKAEVAALIPEGVPMLAAILMEKGVLDRDGVQAALDRQAQTGDSLAQVLMELELAAADQLLDALQTRAFYR